MEASPETPSKKRRLQPSRRVKVPITRLPAESPINTPSKDASSSTAAVEVDNDVITPEWVKILEPVRNLRVNCGSRIRKCVEEALEESPPEWAKKLLEHSISKDVYKSNSSGPTKRAVIAMLDNWKNDPDKEMNSGSSSPTPVEANVDAVPEWVQVLEPVKTLPTKVGSRIRNCVEQSLKKDPPTWAKRILEQSIGPEIYKGNAAGPTKRAVINLLETMSSQNPTMNAEENGNVHILEGIHVARTPVRLQKSSSSMPTIPEETPLARTPDSRTLQVGPARNSTTPTPIANMPEGETDAEKLAFMQVRSRELEKQLQSSEAKRANSDFRNFKALEIMEVFERQLVNLQSDTDRRVEELRKGAAEAIQRLR